MPRVTFQRKGAEGFGSEGCLALAAWKVGALPPRFFTEEGKRLGF